LTEEKRLKSLEFSENWGYSFNYWKRGGEIYGGERREENSLER